MAVDGSDGLRPSKDGHLPSVRGTGTPAPRPWRQCLWAWLPSLWEVGACNPGWAARGGGLCPAVALRELHSGFTSIWVTE